LHEAQNPRGEKLDLTRSEALLVSYVLNDFVGGFLRQNVFSITSIKQM
jgi:hypothetical protein